MFVRIQYRKDNIPMDSLHECRTVLTHPQGPYGLEIRMEGYDKVVINHVLDKRESVAVFVMNAEGQTIDTIFINRDK